jgi:hypothetical protein
MKPTRSMSVRGRGEARGLSPMRYADTTIYSD